MKIAFSVVLLIHALIHLLGVAKGFGLASVDALTLPIGRPQAILWLAATLTTLASVVVLWAAPGAFWWVAALAVGVSQSAIVTSWADARFGTLANGVLLVAALYAARAWGPFGLRAEYRRWASDIVSASAPGPDAAPVTEADLTPLPAPIQRYLRWAGVVGTPRVRTFRARLHGRIRGGPDAPWMPFQAEQYNRVEPARRAFWLEARRSGLPIDALHAYGDGTASASAKIQLLSWIPVVDLSGPTLTRAETVTVFNDLCLFAPAALVGAPIVWSPIDTNTVDAAYTVGPHTIHARLHVAADGALVNFVSDDRPALEPDGKTLVQQRWSTPLSSHQQLGPYRLVQRGEARNEASAGSYAYVEITVDEVTINPTEPPGPP